MRDSSLQETREGTSVLTEISVEKKQIKILIIILLACSRN